MRFSCKVAALCLVAFGAALPALGQNLVTDPGFEQPDITDNFSYRPTGGAWTFVGDAGLTDPPSGFSGTPAPQGTQYAFLQNGNGAAGGTGSSSISQTISGFVVGQEYQVNFQYTARGCCGPTQNANPFEVRINDVAIRPAFTPPTQESFIAGGTPFFTASDETLTLSFVGMGSPGNDVTTFLDAIEIVPEPGTLSVLGLAGLGLLARRRRA